MNGNPPSTVSGAPPASAEPKVGFAGLGAMGLPLARRLVRSGVPLVVYNRTQSKSEALVPEGARWAPSPKDLGKSVGAGVTFLIVTDGGAVKSVLFGRQGYLRGAAPGALLVNLSTIDPDESRSFGARLSEKGIHYLEAPVGGSVEAATRGEVMFFVGGEEADLARARPLLERLGRRAEPVGAVGAGTAMKLVNNLLTIGITALSAEALSFSEALGLDPRRTVDLLKAGGGQSAMLERKAEAFLSRQYPAQFTTQLARKDLRLIERAALREHRSTRMTREARKLLDEAIAQGHAAEDFSSVLEAVRARGTTAAAAVPGTSPPAAPPENPGSPQ